MNRNETIGQLAVLRWRVTQLLGELEKLTPPYALVAAGSLEGREPWINPLNLLSEASSEILNLENWLASAHDT